MDPNKQEILLQELPQRHKCNIYKFQWKCQLLAIKVFPHHMISNSLQEMSYLTRLKHDHIVKFVELEDLAHQYLRSTFFDANLIATQFEKHGNLFDFLLRHFGLPESIVQHYMIQIIQGVKHALECIPPIYHPLLKVENLILSQKYEIKICGWSGCEESAKSEKNLLTQIAQIGITLLTGRPPYSKKNFTDQFYKMLLKDIDNFWSHLQKSIQFKKPEFFFSTLSKSFFQDIFLNKIESVSDLLAHEWLEQKMPLNQVTQAIMNMESEFLRNRLQANYRRRARQIQNQNVLMEHQNILNIPPLGRSQANLHFIQDYKNYKILPADLPIIEKTHPSMFPIFDSQNPRIVFAILNNQFLNIQEKMLPFGSQCLILKDFQIKTKDGSLQINIYLEEMGSVAVKLDLVTHNGTVLADVKTEQSDLNSFIIRSLVEEVKEVIQLYPNE